MLNYLPEATQPAKSRDSHPPVGRKSPLYCGNNSWMRGRDKDEVWTPN